MKKARLLRKPLNDSRGTIGSLFVDGANICHTLERPWRNNVPNDSCIPSGTYTCKRVHSPKFGETFEITGVKDRTHILFHSGNKIADTHGCILIGFQYDDSGAQIIISKSRVAHEAFMKLMEGVDEFELEVV